MNTPWSNDPLANLPFAGSSVEAFIKANFNEKAASGWFDTENMTLYLFRSEADKEAYVNNPSQHELILRSVPMNFSTTQKRIRITPHGSTTINASVNQDEITLAMDVVAETKELTDQAWTETGLDILMRVYIDRNNTGNFEEVPELAQEILSTVGQVSVNVREYVPTGSCRVRCYFFAKDETTLSNSLMWNITLALMYVQPMNPSWDKAIIEGEQTNYRIGGFEIRGNIAKTLHVQVSTATTLKAYYSYDIGKQEYIDNAFFFSQFYGLNLSTPYDRDGNPLPPLTTGVYTVKVWLTSGNISTEDNAVVYNIMYIAAGEATSTALVVMNNSGHVVNNFDQAAKLCDYAVYNKGASYGMVTIEITQVQSGNPIETTQEVQVATGQIQSLNFPINMVTNDQNLSIIYKISIADGNYQQDSSRVDNSDVFPSVSGESFYLNTSLRSNGEVDKETIYNTAQNHKVEVESIGWTRMSWVDGIDGWTEDENGRKCLLLPARTRLTIPREGYRFLTGSNTAFELCYRVANVSDYSENVITIAENPESDGFSGIRIKPTNITVHSKEDASSANDTYQGTNIADEETVHLIVTIQDAFNGSTGNNIVTGYVNGTKAFQFAYPTGTTWSIPNAVAVFGSDTADLYLYMFRVYNGTALSSSGAESNWINAMFTREEKMLSQRFVESVLASAGSRSIDYETIKNSGKYNFFVIEMTDGFVPDKTHPDGGRSNIEMHYGTDANGNARWDWDWKIYDVETAGQGTTSMNYWKWNVRWRIDKTDSSKKREIAYYDAPVISGGVKQFMEKPKEQRKTVCFDGAGNHPEVKRITAKINFASSMQSHKMGATRAYCVLHDNLEQGALLNEAQQAAAAQGKPLPEVAVYQYPAFGFERSYNELGEPTYNFIGLFTIGPDKGDKPTFGWDLVEDDLVSLEGVDHTPQMTKFNVPWDEQTAYVLNSKGDGFIATKNIDGTFTNALEVGNAKDADTGVPSEAMPVLEETFKPAYDVVYDNSTLIFPIALADPDWGGADAAAVLARINSDTDAFRITAYNERLAYQDMEFWIEGEYKLYHFEQESGQYVSGYKSQGAYGTPLDLRTDTGVTPSGTLDEQNEQFKAARRARFMQQAPSYWDMGELVYNYVYLLIFAATDNFAKNQYPIFMGGKWRFRQDDLDTILDIDNNGGQTKSAYIEYGDAVGGSPYFAGSNSVLWNLVNESLWDDFTANGTGYSGIMTIGRKTLETMSSLASGNNVYDGFIKFFDQYFWSRAQEYFPPSAYNIDGNFKYEDAWLAGQNVGYTSVFPLRQSLGSHHEAERLWVRRRALYCMSLFKAGPFGNYSQTYLGAIMFRPTALGTLTVTPAETMYPCVIDGANNIKPNARTQGGQPFTFTGISGDGNTTFTIQGVDMLTSLGNLKHLAVGSDDGGMFNLSGKKLREFMMCDDDPTEVDTNITKLNLDGNGLPCLEVIDLHNAQTLTGTLYLGNCKRIKEVYVENTHIGGVKLPRGSKVEKLHLSDHITTLSYQVLRHLSDLVLPADTSGITLIYLEECDLLDGMETLEQVYLATGQTLENIKIIMNGETPVTGSQLSMLAHIMNNLDKDGLPHDYFGVDASGGGSSLLMPHVEGALLAGKYYEDDIEQLANGQTPSDSTAHPGLKEIVASYFGPLRIAFPVGDQYVLIPFADPAVRQICVTQWGSDGGITKQQAAAVTQLSGFYQNTDIVSFDEFEFFTGVKTLGGFNGCTNLKSIKGTDLVETISDNAFYNCASLESDLSFESVIEIRRQAFFYCNKVKKIIIGPNCTSIGQNCFQSTALDYLVIKAETPPAIYNSNIFWAATPPAHIYVPDNAVEAYKAAQYWSASNLVSRITPMSQLPTT